jgi:membrane-bound ClpP family serine protease
MSTETTGHNVRPTSWAAVLLIVVASILLGFALPMRSLPLAIAGGVVMLVGLVVAAVYRIMDDAY